VLKKLKIPSLHNIPMNDSPSLSRRNKSIANICLKKSIANIYYTKQNSYCQKRSDHGSHNDVKSLEKNIW